MNRYEFEEGQIFYSRFDVEVYDIDGETVASTVCMEEDEAEDIYNALSSGGGGSVVMRELQYSKPNFTGYLRTVIRKTK